MKTLTIKIANMGTALSNGGESKVGHMWYTLSDGVSAPTSFGFSPAEGSSSSTDGDVNKHDGVDQTDDTAYVGDLYYTQTIVITDEQYDAMKAFGQAGIDAAAGQTITVTGVDGVSRSFDLYYSGFTNSCIDFVWKALQIGGLNPAGFEGLLWPTWNQQFLKESIDYFLEQQANGGQAGTYTTADGQGNTYTIVSDGNGNIRYTWQGADGQSGISTFNADNSSMSELFDASGSKTADTWKRADGTYGSDSFNPIDGSVTGIAYNPDGSHSSFISDGQGNVTSNTFDIAGNKQTEDWQRADGSSGKDIFNADGQKTASTYQNPDGTHGSYSFNPIDGSVSGIAYNPDGSHSSFISDGQGNVTSNTFDPAGNKQTEDWQRADGSSGTDIFNADGSSSGIAYNADGSYSTYFSDGQGNIRIDQYDQDGNPIGGQHWRVNMLPPNPAGVVAGGGSGSGAGGGSSSGSSSGSGSGSGSGSTTTPGTEVPPPLPPPGESYPVPIPPPGSPAAGAGASNASAGSGAGGTSPGAGAAGGPGAGGGAGAAASGTAAPPPNRDPLVLDIDGDGIETTSISNGKVILFDHNADGVKTGTGWVKADDGWLVMDRNGNGSIDSGRELFGVDTLKSNGASATDGFDALRDNDTNQDGKIDAADGVFANLRIWRDLNQDGISQTGELTTLDENNITAIGVNSTAINLNLGNGNIQTAAGTFTRSDGVTGETGETNGEAGNLNLLVNTFYRQFSDRIALTDQAKALPTLQGSGRVRDLDEAISLSPELGNWVQTYAQQTTRQGQIDLLDGFIEGWADTADLKSLKAQADALTASGVTLTYNLGGLSAGTPAYEQFLRKLGVVERFMGFTYGGASGQARFTPLDATSGNLTVSLAAQQVASISLAYDRFKTDIYESLLLPTRLSPYTALVGVANVGGQFVLDFQPLEAAFSQAIATQPRDGIIDLVEFLSAAGQTRLEAMGWKATDFLVAQLNNIPDIGALTEELSSWTVRFAGTTEHNLAGTSRGDLLVGTEGGDTLSGSDGADFLLGGAGNDILNGGTGSDSYVYRRGDGYDTVQTYDSGTSKVDTLLLADLNPADIRLEKWGNDLAFIVNDGNQWVKVESFFASAPYQLDAVQFADGTTWDRATLMAQPMTLHGGAGNDTLSGHNGGANTLYGYDGADNLSGGDKADQIFGGTGNDSLSGYAGNDVLLGESGNDTLTGDTGNDTLDGGLGNDILNGGAGSDTYVYRRGGGYDTLQVNDYGTGKVDTLRLEDLNPADLRLEKWGDDLAFIVNDGNQWVKVESFFASAPYQLDAVQFADGTIWDRATLMAQPITLHGGAGNDTLSGHNGGANTLYGYDGADNLSGGDKADQIFGGTGNDYLYGRVGDDTLLGESGNDTLTGEAGNDKLDGGLGNDILNGGAGSDTYVYRRGGGYDTLQVNDYGTGKVDTLRLEDLNPADLRLEKWGNDLAFIVNDGNQWVKVEAFFVAPAYQLDAVQFADGTTWDRATLMAQPMTLNGGAGNDTLAGHNGGANTLYGYDGADNLYGGDKADQVFGGNGDDQLYGYAGNDVLEGGAGNNNLDGSTGVDTASYASALAGISVNLAVTTSQNTLGAGFDTLVGIENVIGSAFNDTLTGNSGNNTLDGAAGNDSLVGGAGNDTYLFGRGYGADTVTENDATVGNADLAQFAAGISIDQLWFRHVGNNLEASIIGTADTLTIQNWYSGNACHVEQFKTADGMSLLDSRVDNLVQAMAAFAPPGAAQTTLSPEYQAALAPVIAANWQ